MRMILVFVAVISLAVGQGQRYLSLPFVSRESEGRTEHIINIQINRFPYLIDIAIDDRQTYFLNLSEVSRQKEMGDGVYYRRGKKGMLGVFEFMGVQQPDWRLQPKRRYAYALYYLIRDLLPQVAGFNLQSVKQIAVGERPSTVSQGRFNFGPSGAEDSALVDLRRYSAYMKEPIVSFSMHETAGNIFLGAFPLGELRNPLAYQTVKLQSKNDFWEVAMQSLVLKIRKDKDIQRVSLFEDITQFKLTLGSKTLVLPKASGEAIEKSIAGCKFVVEKGSAQRYLECSDLGQTSIQKLELQFSVAGSTLPLVFGLKHLLKLRENGLTTFHVSWDDDDKLQIGETLLRQYMLGINYREGLLYYGKGAEEGYIDRFFIFRSLAIINLLAFAVSLLVVVTMGGQSKEMGSTKVEGSRYFPRSSGYQMAEVTEESLGE